MKIKFKGKEYNVLDIMTGPNRTDTVLRTEVGLLRIEGLFDNKTFFEIMQDKEYWENDLLYTINIV